MSYSQLLSISQYVKAESMATSHKIQAESTVIAPMIMFRKITGQSSNLNINVSIFNYTVNFINLYLCNMSHTLN